MKTFDVHSVFADVKDDGTDVWQATWARDGFIRIYRGDTNNNRVVMNHLMNIEWDIDESVPITEQLRIFNDSAYALLEALIFPKDPQVQI